MSKTYENKTKFSEFSRDFSREELKIKKLTSFCNVFFAMASLQWLPCNEFVEMTSFQ